MKKFWIIALPIIGLAVFWAVVLLSCPPSRPAEIVGPLMILSGVCFTGLFIYGAIVSEVLNKREEIKKIGFLKCLLIGTLPLSGTETIWVVAFLIMFPGGVAYHYPEAVGPTFFTLIFSTLFVIMPILGAVSEELSDKVSGRKNKHEWVYPTTF